jgi:hypothetical protein
MRVMSTAQRYKARFNTRLPNGDFLGVTVWPGKSDPSAEVITVQIRHQSGDIWETVSRIAIYRTSDGRHLLLPEKQIATAPAKAEPVELGASGESYE